MKISQVGFTLIELMIVVAIIGILAALAIPSYNDYTARAQVSEAASLTAGFKTGIAEYYAIKSAYPANLTNIGTTTSGKYVGSITLTSGGANGTVTAVMGSNVNKNIKSSTFVMVSTDGSLTWTCGNGNIDSRFLPSSCK